MKKMLLTILAFTLGTGIWAQDGLGVFVGGTFSKVPVEGDTGIEAGVFSRYHVGLAYKVPLFLGFAVQPQLQYNVKGTVRTTDRPSPAMRSFDLRMGYAEAAVQLQWGPDLLLMRPYLFVEPFIGMATDNKVTAAPYEGAAAISRKNYWDYLSRMDYGFGLGAGLEVMDRVQLSARFFWNGGSLYNGENRITVDDYFQYLGQLFREKEHFSGVSVTLGVFF